MSWFKDLLPVLQWLPNYHRDHLKGDVSAGLTVGIMLIPQGMAYAMIAGLPPVYGLYASIVPQLVYALFGTSRQLSVAPVAMDSLLVAAGVSVMATEGSDTYIAFAILLAFFMGAFQLMLGIFRMGFITNLLSKPVISGFTSAAAIIIGLNQLKYLLGVEIARSSQVFEIIWDAINKVDETHFLTLGIGIAGILLIKGVKKIHSGLPAPLIVVILGITMVYGLNLDQNGVAIVKEIPSGMPSFQLPQFRLGQFAELIPLALTISVVAFMESFSVAKAIEAKRNDYKVIANQELIGLGAANLIGSLFQSYPVTGGFSRSAVNYQSGARTPLASVISAGVIILTLLFFTPLFYYLPKAILAAVIMVAITSLIDFQYPKTLWKQNKVEFGLLIVTFLVTLNFSMVPGILTGVVLSILILIYKTAYPHIAILGRLPKHSEFRNIKRFMNLEIWSDKLIVRIDAPITFINIQYIKDFINKEVNSNVALNEIILDASAISHIDSSGFQGLLALLKTLQQKQIILKITNLVGPVRDMLFRSGFLDEVGEVNIYLTLQDALELGPKIPFSKRKKLALQHGEAV